MAKKRTFVLLFVTALLILELFGPLGGGQEASAASDPGISVSVGWVKPPPETVCLGDDIPVIYVFVVFNKTTSSTGGVTSVPGNTYTGELAATTKGIGAVSPYKVYLGLTGGSGRVYATYKATKTGFDVITVDGIFVTVDPAGASTGSFEVVRCDYNISIGASDFVSASGGEFDTEFHGKGTISTGDTGMVMGTGTYQYNITIDWVPPETVTCETLYQVTNNSTFEVSGTASVERMTFQIKFYPVDLKPVTAHCQDQEGKTVDTQLFPGGSVDVDGALHLPTYGIPTSLSEISFSFPYGKGTGMIWLVKRKSK